MWDFRETPVTALGYRIRMAAFLGYRSAYATLRERTVHGGKLPPAARISTLPASALETNASVGGCPRESFVGGKAHLLVSTPAARSENPACSCHVWSGRIPSGSFLALGDGVYANSPEFLFMQMATKLDFAEAVAFGFELCGTYFITEAVGRGFMASVPRLATASRIRAFLDKMEGCYGVRKARKVLAWVLDDSASPMETALAMLVGLPKSRGGRGLSGLQLNREFPLTREWRRRLGRQSFKPDLFFPSRRVAVEYYGFEDHHLRENREYDELRRGIMEYLGIRVLTVTKQQLYRPEKLEGAMKELHKLLGVRYRKPTQAQQMATLALKDSILPYHDSSKHLGSFLA